MRDLLITGVFLVWLLQSIPRPHYGVLLWSLFSYMNPHRLAWGFAYSFPFVYIAALTTVISYLFSKEKKSFPVCQLTILWAIFILWVGLTTLFALVPDYSQELFTKAVKIQAIILMTLLLFQSRERIEQLIWIIFISIGYYGVKGGIFTLLTGGSFIVWGPADSDIEGNNELAIAILMVIPLVVYLRKYSKNIWVKRGLVLSILFMALAVIGSQSRGAFLALMAVGFYFLLKTNRKLIVGISFLLFILVMIPFVPDSWVERMNSIQSYEQDRSAQGRIRAWRYAINLADSRLTGGGFGNWTKLNYLIYLPSFDESERAYVAHSIYFSVLGDHGWPGFLLFAWIFFLTWRYLNRLIKTNQGSEEMAWIVDLSQVLKISLLAYFSGGAFLSLSYFDLPWHLVAITVLMRTISGRAMAEQAKHMKKTGDGSYVYE